MPIGFIRGLSSVTDPASGGRIYTFENVKSEDVPKWQILQSGAGNARQYHGCAIADGKMFVVGGHFSYGSTLSAKYTNLAYIIASDSWGGATEFGTSTRVGGACTSGYRYGKNYVFFAGGATSYTTSASNYVWMYDPDTDTWTSLIGMLSSLMNASCAYALYNHSLYVIGGASSYTSTAFTNVHKYDLATSSWSTVAEIPVGRQFATATIVGNYIYVFGGSTTYSTTATNGAYRYDIELDTWSELVSLPSNRAGHAAAAIGTKIYVFGGIATTRSTYLATDTIYCYDTKTDEWSLLPKRMIAVMADMSAESYNDEIYLFGGIVGSQNSASNFSPFPLRFSLESEPSFEIRGENKLLFDKDVLIDGVIIPANTETTVNVESATVIFPEMTSGTIVATGNVNIT